MQIRRIFYSSRFERSLKALPVQEKKIIIEREKIFRANCFDPRLKTHKLKGRIKEYWSFSLTHSHRVLFEFISEEIVAFIDVGDHSIYQ